MAKPATLKANCPHCHTANQAFVFKNGYSFRETEYVSIDVITFACNACQRPIVVMVGRDPDFPDTWSASLNLTSKFKDGLYVVVATYPEEPTASPAPDHSPTNIASFFNQGSRALRAGDYDLAGMGFRKAIDTSTKELIRATKDADFEAQLKKTFYARIDWLYSTGRLTEDIRAWAHIVRLEGNEAAHEEDPYSKADAEQLYRFTQMLLMYIYTLPGMVRMYRPEQPSEQSEAQG